MTSPYISDHAGTPEYCIDESHEQPPEQPQEQPQEQRECEVPLSYDAVADWLVIQDDATRSACAAILADDLEVIRQTVHAQAMAEGRAEGERTAEQAVAGLTAALQALTASAEQTFEEEQRRVAALCSEVVLEALTKIAGRALVTSEAVTSVVLEVLKGVKDGCELTIRVCPSDLDALKREEHRFEAALPGRRFVLLADPRVDLGGCIVESQFGALDGRLEVQLRELYHVLHSAKWSAD